MPSKRQRKTRSREKREGPESDKQQDKGQHARFQGSGPRPFWSGTISFGLVNLPVNLYSANRAKPVTLRMVDQEGTPLARRYFCEKEERTLENSELIRGYEVGKNEFVVVEDRELDELAPEKSQEIDLKRFAGLDEIDPIHFQRAYILTPDKGITKAYRLLAKSMEESRRAGIATFVMRGKEYLVAIIAEKGILRAEVLRFPEELRSPEALDLPTGVSVEKRRVRHFEKAIEALAADTLAREDLDDRHSRRLLARIHDKLDRNEDVIGLEEVEQEVEQGGDVIDLMQVLKQSLKKGRPPESRDESRRDTQRRSERKGPASASRKRSEERASHVGKKAGKKAGEKAAKRTGKTPSVTELTSLSKNELYERARQLGIPGRSSMSKPRLIEAIEASP
ncbi:Ku protein [Billgrantia endophytica]|uniref:Ku protein n=1 Tax=Billgrantia endophytica TaxID=2033802 RepID=A0A2N7U846_9GAMM|nr:Ku protein [Halomonas endophytica]PMR76608.1 Ku protein [Halomonas endophytica]